MPKINLNKSSFQNHILVIALLAIIILTAGYFITSMINNFYYEQMEQESQRLATRYAQNMETAIEASDIINSLLEEKILAAGEVVAYYETPQSNELLKEIARVMEVDDIYFCKPSGEIIYSNNGKYIGWKPDEKHPVYKFMQSGLNSMVEEIRQDTESGIYYKYGYFRATNGCFVQIGVLAEKIYDFLGSFEMKHMLADIKQDDYVNSVYFIDNGLTIIAQAEETPKPETILTKEAKAAIAANQKYTKMLMLDNQQVYQIMIPIFVDDKKAGTLVINYNTQGTQTLIRNLSLVVILALAFTFLLLLITIGTTYNKNQKLAQYAYYDILTGLPNKRNFDEFVQSHKGLLKKSNKALLLVNCRNFKLINFTYGYKTGDEVIKEIAAILSEICLDDCHLFHLGGDRFIICISEYKNKANLSNLCDYITENLKNSLSLKTIEIVIGVVETNNINIDSINAESLLQKAYLAAESVNKQDHFGYSFFDDDMEAKRLREEEIKNELEKMVMNEKNNNIFLEYQPILNLETNCIFGFEALARLNSEKLGLVSPMKFIPIAEKTPMIVPLGKKIILMACNFLKNLEKQGFTDTKVSVNISAIQLLRDDFLPNLMQIINETQIDPHNFGIEITESVFSDNYELINNKLAKIQALGIQIAIDDFGTGYSSLSRERDLNINCLKIDKSFIDKLMIIEKEKTITCDIISMAHKLNHLVIAEGVEFEAQKEYLINNNCDCIQGYLFSKPLSQEAAIEMLKKENRTKPN